MNTSPTIYTVAHLTAVQTDLLLWSAVVLGTLGLFLAAQTTMTRAYVRMLERLERATSRLRESRL